MAINFPGPYEVEINYTEGGFDHKMRVNCDAVGNPSVGDLATTIQLNTRNGGDVELDVAVDLLVEKLLPIMPSSCSFNTFDFYRYDVGTFDRTWISTGIIDEVGTNASPVNPAHQVTFTFRTQEGGIMRMVLLDDSGTFNDRVLYVDASVVQQALMDYVTGLTSWILARDTSYPIAPLARVGGQNETAFKRRYR